MTQTATNTGTVECIGLIGPMKIAWERTFQPGVAALAPCLVIVWHSEWMNPRHGLWNELYEKLKTIGDGTRILVVIFGDTPDDLGEDNMGNPLRALLRAIAEDDDGDNDGGCGWAAISNVASFQSASENLRKDPDSAVFRLCRVCAAIGKRPNSDEGDMDLAPVSLVQFFQSLKDPVRFRASILHDAKKPDQERRRLCELKWLATHALISQSHSGKLKILVVENEPKGLCIKNLDAAKRCSQRPDLAQIAPSPLRYIPNAEFYVVRADFATLKANSYASVQARKCSPDSWDTPAFWDDKSWDDKEGFTTIPWAEIDLVLQDVMLGPDAGSVTGLTLAPFYFEACPQALVCLLTGLDIESIVVSGDVNWRYVDAVIPKDGLENLWFEYRRCFLERFGRMFWKPWMRALTRKPETPTLGDSQSLRDLFRCLRKWQIEPAILGHGQGVHEMIDHAHRHISKLWRLADDVLGTFLDNCRPQKVLNAAEEVCGQYLSVPERMLFAMSVWLHDIGHRGDDFLSDSGDIRINHAGISEHLLLRNPKAFEIEWLKTNFCKGDCIASLAGSKDNKLLDCRNELHCRHGGGEICPIRKLGLLCRHHQSNAPLDRNSLDRMSKKGKAPSPYSRISIRDQSGLVPNTTEDLATWLNPDLPLTGWQGSEVRSFDQFNLGEAPEVILSFAGLLRMLDALQLHRDRIGTPASIGSFTAYLDTRAGWCQRELQRVKNLTRMSLPGTKVYQENLAEYMRLRRYERLLNVQYVHYWRQIAVRDVTVNWVWLPAGDAALRIFYEIDDWGLDAIEDMDPVVSRVRDSSPKPTHLKQVLKEHVSYLCKKNDDISKWLRDSNRGPLQQLGDDAHLLLWAVHVRDDVIMSEHHSQDPAQKGDRRAYVRFLPEGVAFEVAILGRAVNVLSFGKEVLLLERKDFF